MNTSKKAHRIALLFNANKSFDREVISGIAAYLSSTRAAWDLFLEEDFRLRLTGIEHWQGDGIIADFDDPAVGGAGGTSGSGASACRRASRSSSFSSVRRVGTSCSPSVAMRSRL